MRFADIVDRVTRGIGRVSAWLVLAAALLSAGNALMRKVFAVSSNAMLEAQWYLVGISVMLGAAWVLQDNAHIRIELLSSRFSAQLRRRIEILGHLLMLLPFAGLMLWLCWPYFARSFAQNETSINTGGLLVWPMRGVIAAGFLLLCLQSLATLVRLLNGGAAPAPTDQNDLPPE
ncbi:TRAP transporter small permease subunit [Chachezhania sediminis]|uniref:TRAP transporter small permease subunit n=1 Tax=Chachezhania sediminis TaxID=2599291 RepID=UPI00131B6DE4|nr:TRAP transporter small permease subunit [Chachezhania sediminis]